MDRNVEKWGWPAPDRPWLSQEGLPDQHSALLGKSGATGKREEGRTGEHRTWKVLTVGLGLGVLGSGKRAGWALQKLR